MLLLLRLLHLSSRRLGLRWRRNSAIRCPPSVLPLLVYFSLHSRTALLLKLQNSR